jgi:hypothetical protein
MKPSVRLVLVILGHFFNPMRPRVAGTQTIAPRNYRCLVLATEPRSGHETKVFATDCTSDARRSVFGMRVSGDRPNPTVAFPVHDDSTADRTRFGWVARGMRPRADQER